MPRAVGNRMTQVGFRDENVIRDGSEGSTERVGTVPFVDEYQHDLGELPQPP